MGLYRKGNYARKNGISRSAKIHIARELRFDVFQTSSLRPFHRFLRPACAELVSGGRLPTISVRGWTAPSLYVFLAVTLSGLFILCISKILRQAVITLHKIHFASQCATERVYRYLPAKVELKKSHFGKPPLTECALCSPPCQSDLMKPLKII